MAHKPVIEWTYQAPPSFVEAWKKGKDELEAIEEKLKADCICPDLGTFRHPQKVKLGSYTLFHEGSNLFVLLGPGSFFDPSDYFENVSDRHEGKHIVTKYSRGEATRYLFEDGKCKAKKTAQAFPD